MGTPAEAAVMLPAKSTFPGKNALPLVGTLNVALSWPSGTRMGAGFGIQVVLLLEKVTTTPPAIAGAFKVTEPVAVPPIVMLDGLNVTEATLAPGLGARITPISNGTLGKPLASDC